MKILIYDETPQKNNWLDESWWTGAWFAKMRRRFDHKIGATSWPDALEKLLKISEGKKIHELHYWGHGSWGRVSMGGKAITAVALTEPKHIWHAQLKELATRFTASSTVWFRVCAAFGNCKGKVFAKAVSEHFGCRVIGATFLIGPIHGGLHSVRPGQEPSWPDKEGVKIVDGKERPRKSWFSSPNWIFFTTSHIVESW